MLDLIDPLSLSEAGCAELIVLEELFIRKHIHQDLRVLVRQDPGEFGHFKPLRKQHALAHEDIEDIIPAAVHRLVIGLPLGNDHVRTGDRLARFPRQNTHYCPVCRCPVANAPAEFGHPDLLCVFHRRIVGDRRAAYDHCDRQLRILPFQLADQYFVHDDLAAVVRNIRECFGR